MAHIDVDGTSVTVRLQGLERLWAMRTKVTADRAAVRRATTTLDLLSEVRGVRAPGLALPGRIKVGTWRSRQGKDLVVARRGQPGVVLELDGTAWRRFLIGCPDLASAERTAASF